MNSYISLIQIKHILLDDIDPILMYLLITSVSINLLEGINSATLGEENSAANLKNVNLLTN